MHAAALGIDVHRHTGCGSDTQDLVEELGIVGDRGDLRHAHSLRSDGPHVKSR